MFKGHIAHLLRHPCGAPVVDDLYTQANAQQRSAMVAELYGREYVLFSSETKRLPELFEEITVAQQRTVLRHISQHAIPIMEKAMIDPAIVHRWGPLQEAAHESLTCMSVCAPLSACSISVNLLHMMYNT